MKLKKEQIKKIILKINSHWQKFWFHYFCGAVILACLLTYYIFRAIFPTPTEILKIKTETPTVVEEIAASIFRHPLTGELVETEIERPQVFAVMVENSAEAWPLSGVEDAFLVIEAPVEAKIPRLLAFYYAGQEVEKIGPVRSARPYYLDWASEFGAMYVHCGGAPEALSLLADGELSDLNEFWNSEYFWRSATRSAPHNVYTSSELLEKAAVSIPEFSYGLWTFKDGEPLEDSSNSNLKIEDGLAYFTEWRYDASNNNYVRWQGGEEVKTFDGEQILADNVAVVYTSISIIDAIGRREIETVGEGDALVLQDGRKINAVWKKEAADERLRFYAEDGKEIVWNSGKTWVEVVSTAALLSEP